MKVFLLIFSCLSALNFNAQAWCAPGSIWYNDYGGSAASGFSKQTYLYDTLVGSQTYNKIQVYKQGVRGFSGAIHNFSQQSYAYTKTLNNVVYLDKDTLFSTAFSLGTKWRLPLNEGAGRCQSIVTLTDTGHLSLQGVSHKYLAVTINKENYSFFDTIIDKIGYLKTYVFLPGNWCMSDCLPEFGGALKCFSNNHININYAQTNCDEYPYATSLTKIFRQGSVTFYPNPTNGLLHIASTTLQEYIISICDLTGKQIKAIGIQAGTNEPKIDLSFLSEGFYFVRILNGNTPSAFQKVSIPK